VGVEIRNALGIFGWMEGPELTWLAAQAKKRECIVEIGSFVGRSTRALGDNTIGHVHAIDHWDGPRDFEIPFNRAELYNRFRENMKDLLGDKVLPIKMDCEDLDSLELACTPDMVFIDADHTTEAVIRDIRWAKKVIRRPGGLLCGHDADWPSVQEALRQELPYYNLFQHDIWWNRAD